MALIDDPAVAALVQKQIDKALTTQAKEHKSALKTIVKKIKETTADHVDSHKANGDKASIGAAKELGTVLATYVKDSHLAADAA